MGDLAERSQRIVYGERLLRVLAGESLEPPPIWLMRQAGRYLPEYRAVREQAGGFLDLCYTPALAAEVTLQPIRRFGFDAAILFSDILVVPHALGQRAGVPRGRGPVPRADPQRGRAHAPRRRRRRPRSSRACSRRWRACARTCRARWR